MSKWDSPATATVNIFKTYSYTKRCDDATKRSLKYKLIKIIIQKNTCRLHDWPVDGPDPFMWYVYPVRRPMQTVSNTPRFSVKRFYYSSVSRIGQMGHGRNMIQAIKDFERKMLWANRGKQVI